ncbi:MAG: hypothetical protein OXG39_07885 [Chloroflexi bacterium]|nr:hypothetical protein [Chloroflexota bacterium]
MPKKKAEPHTKPNKYKFVIGWALAWMAASELPVFVDTHIWPLDFFSYAFAYFALLATFQFFWVRRHLRVNLRHWITLTLLGVVFAILSNSLIATALSMPGSPGLWDPMAILGPDVRYADSIYIAMWTLFWFMPDFFQWFALRKRFRLHGLWLLVIVAAALFSVFLEEQGIFTQALVSTVGQTGNMPLSTSQLLIRIFDLVDWALPPAIMGFVLYYMVCESQTKQTPPG